jgi:cytoskeletal protein CcmA (bactofilin family)
MFVAPAGDRDRFPLNHFFGGLVMLRMGKTPNEEKSPNPTQSSADTYAPRTYSPYQSSEEVPTAPRALSESETIAREIKDGTLSGFVGSGTNVTGEATFKSLLRIDGHFSGRISSPTGTLIVGSGGQVDANIEVAVAQIQGSVNGDIVANQRIELGRAGKLNGNIQTPSLVIEQGGVFEGSSKMVQQQKAATEKAAPKVDRRENVLDSTKFEAVKVDSAKKPEDNAPKVASVALAS